MRVEWSWCLFLDCPEEKKIDLRSAIAPIFLALAFWPVWLWFFARTLDKSDEPWGLLSLATAIALLVIARKAKPDNSYPGAAKVSKVDFALGVAFLVIYIVVYPVAPNLVLAILFVLTLWFLFASSLPMPSKSGIIGLLLLSLPIVPSLNFFAGYPLRLLVAQGASLMLSMLGMYPTIDGVMVVVNGHPSAIDAPCSGINMLWTELYLAMLFSCMCRLRWRQTALLTLVAFALVVVANILRATTLIVFDQIVLAPAGSSLAVYEPSVHLLVGLIIFCAICILTFIVASRLSNACKVVEKIRAERKPHNLDEASTISTLSGKRQFAPSAAVIALGVVASLVPLIARPSGSSIATVASPNWPLQINGQKLVAVDAFAEEVDFARDFPGLMKRFTDGTNSYFIRYVRKETRQLHSSADCLKGMGYAIEPRPITVEQDGTKWGTFAATKSGSHYLVRERIYDGDGVSSTDVSQWYWLAILKKTHGPWFAVTVAEPLSP